MSRNTIERMNIMDKPDPLILALDVGTSSTRALLFDTTGAEVSDVKARETYELTITGEGEVSVDADELVGVVAKTIDQALQQAGSRASSIGAVGADTFWHSLIGVDADGQAITPLITWEDTRPREAAAELCRQLDEDAIHRRTGARLHASYWPAKLRWLAKTQPDAFKRAAQWLSFGEYLHRKLLGKSVCSLSMASGTGMLDIKKRAWDGPLMEALGVRDEQMPELGDLPDSMKGLAPDYERRWPALRDVPWFPAIGDGAAANAGSGCVAAGHWALTIGTTSAMRVVVSPDTVEPLPALWLYLLDGKRGLLGGALSEGGNVLAWLSKTLRLPPLEEAEPKVRPLPPDGHGLTILPFISGERSLGWHAEARAVIAGIQTKTAPEEMLRAAMESLAYQLAQVYDQLLAALDARDKKPRLVCSGGALLNSPTLQHILADTLDTPLYALLEREASARGVALVALEALGVIPNISQAKTALGDPVTPDAQNGRIYREAVRRQQELYGKLLG
jgi:gluconokinase